jgi:hypothetical protein
MKAISRFFILLPVFSACSKEYHINVIHLSCGFKVNPFGIDMEKPGNCWNLESEKQAVSHNAYPFYSFLTEISTV